MNMQLCWKLQNNNNKIIISFQIRAREGQASLHRKPRWEVDQGGLGHGAKELTRDYRIRFKSHVPTFFPDEFG